MKKMNLTLPAWTKETPTKLGTYICVDKFGSVQLHEVISVKGKDSGLLATNRGLYFLDPRFGPFHFSGPLIKKHFFDAKMQKEIDAAIDGIPAQNLKDAEERAAQFPRSRKAKAAVVAAKAALAKSR